MTHLTLACDIGVATLADAILNRLVHNAHQLNLKGDSMRKNGRFDQLAPSEVKLHTNPAPSRPRCSVWPGTSVQLAAKRMSSFCGIRSIRLLLVVLPSALPLEKILVREHLSMCGVKSIWSKRRAALARFQFLCESLRFR